MHEENVKILVAGGAEPPTMTEPAFPEYMTVGVCQNLEHDDTTQSPVFAVKKTQKCLPAGEIQRVVHMFHACRNEKRRDRYELRHKKSGKSAQSSLRLPG